MCGSHEFNGVVKMEWSSGEYNYFLQQLAYDFEWSSYCISYNYTFPNACPSSSIPAFLCSSSLLTSGRLSGSTASQKPSGLVYTNQAWSEKEEVYPVYEAGLDERCSEKHHCNEGKYSCNKKFGRKEISLLFKLFLSSPYLTNRSKTPLKEIFPTWSAKHWQHGHTFCHFFW